MRSFSTHSRALAGVVTLVVASVAAGGLIPQNLVCQETECEHGRIYLQKGDGGVFLCVEDLDCGNMTAEKFCVRLGA